MTSNQEESSSGNTKTHIKVYVTETRKQKWKKQAKEESKTLSKYLVELICEAQIYREEDFLTPHNQEAQIQKLKQEINELRNRSDTDTAQDLELEVNEDALKTQVLTDKYQTLQEILHQFFEHTDLDQVIRKPVEDELYYLAAQEEVEFQRGFGWKLTEENRGGE